MLNKLLPLILILLLTFISIGNCADWLEGWDYRIELKIENYAVDIGAEVEWWPATIFLTDEQCEEVFAELTTDAEYKKVAITKADGTTELYGDNELFDVSALLGIYHVSRDGWVINANTSVFFYYDKDHIDNDTYISKSGGTAAQSVWDGDFKAVYHMNDISDTHIIYDTQYEATVEPDSDGWTQEYDDFADVSAGILTIDTTDDANRCFYYKQPNVDFDTGVYLKTRVKTSTDMNIGDDELLFQIYDGTQNQTIQFAIRKGSVISTDQTGGFTQTKSMDTTTSYVVYEFYVKANYYWIYADSVEILSSLIFSSSIDDRIGFGERSESKMCKAEIDYVYYALGVTDNPLLTIFDSTSNNNDGTKKGLDEPIEAAGQVGQGQDFDGTDDYIYCGNDSSLDIGAVITVETIIKWTDKTYCYLFNFLADYTDYETSKINLAIAGTGNELGADVGEIYMFDGSSVTQTNFTISAATYTHLAFCRSGTGANETQIYKDGSSEWTGTWTPTQSTPDFVLGYMGHELNYTDGIEDEVRVSSAARSAAWIKGTYNSGDDALFTYGSEETEEAPVVTNIMFMFSDF